MSDAKTLVILNPHAGSGRALATWQRIAPIIQQSMGALFVEVTQRPDDVAPILDHAYQSGWRRVIAIGGDGTNHAVINAILSLQSRYPDQPPMTYGNIPVGTGRDWARNLGVPIDDPVASAHWLANATPTLTDIGLLTHDAGQRYFLNIASAGLTSDVVARVNRKAVRRPWTFLAATVSALLTHQPRRVQITLDGQAWYDDRAFCVVVANGTTFGHGMRIAPDAQTQDGKFDVVLIEDMPRLQAILALQSVYGGRHVTHPRVQIAQASEVRLTTTGDPLGLELDGEQTAGQNLVFRVQPQRLALLA